MNAWVRKDLTVTNDDLRRMTAEEKKELLVRRLTKGDVEFRAERPGVTIAEADGSAHIRHFSESTLEYGPGLQPIKRYVKAPEAVFVRTPPKRRTPMARVESLTRRYVAEWERGNHAALEAIGADILGEYWKAGTPITAERLRELAAAGLQRAEAQARLRQRKKITEDPVR